MPMGPGSTLHREPRGLVDDKNVAIAVEDAPSKLRSPTLNPGMIGGRASRCAGYSPLRHIVQRRYANKLSGRKAQVALGAPAVDANLTCAEELLQPAMADPREVTLEPPIKPLLGLTWIDGDGLGCTQRPVPTEKRKIGRNGAPPADGRAEVTPRRPARRARARRGIARSS
jgi:hypothetical protein